MSDLISREEMISQLEYCLANCTDYKEALEETLRKVKGTRGVEPQEWISVKDRKPTMSDNFYVTIQYPLHRGVEKVFYSVQQNKWYSVDADRIIAWREVEPSPYKGE